MESETSKKLVDVTVTSFLELFAASEHPISVDTYQRGFVWNDEKITQLVDDLADYQQGGIQGLSYYMGTILIHKNNEKAKRFIIDGQQRLTALCVLHQVLTNNLPVNCGLSYSPQSARRIRSAASIFRDYSRHPTTAIFKRIVFTVISVDSVDLAFTFFDTQNNRGVQLHATDLLKAYHLRAIEGETPERNNYLQTLCAARWERLQQSVPLMSHDQEFAKSLFSKFLWRARYWTGSRVAYGGHDALMDEFQKQTWKAADKNSTIPLYRTRQNRLGSALSLTTDGHSEIHTSRISLSPNPEDLPFAIRQPIQKGIGFFLFSDKYSALLHRLVLDPTDSKDVKGFREVYKCLIKANSLYLEEVYLLASLMYFDQFEGDLLWEFSLWLEHAMGAIRLSKQQVRYETAQNFVKQDPSNPANLNLLDVISNSFRPEQIIDHLKKYHMYRDIYANETIEAGIGVQGKYKQAVQHYFNKDVLAPLDHKHKWIDAKLTGVCA